MPHLNPSPLSSAASAHFTLSGLMGCFAFLMIAGLAAPFGAGALERKPLDQLPSIKDLPDPFLFADGSRVKSLEDWSRRRKELIDLVLAYEYGELPPAISNVTAKVLTAGPTTRPAEMPGVTESTVLLSMGPEQKILLHLHITIPAPPASANAEVKFPVIVRGDLGWGAVKPEISAAVIQRGYILIQFDRTELAIDQKATLTGGVYTAWPDYSGSAMSAWAWGYQRVVDYVLTRPDVDAKHIAITGHSRGGKAVLLAGAIDERIALVAPNASGCGGCGCYRFQAPKSEAIENITKNFPYWFEARFTDFIGHVDRLPFDQHSIKALVAPRAFLETSGLGDLWANPEGSQQSWLAAREVFDFLGAKDQMGIAWRAGIHEHNLRDWSALLDFADWRFFGKKPERAFDTLAYPRSERRFTWGRP